MDRELHASRGTAGWAAGWATGWAVGWAADWAAGWAVGCHLVVGVGLTQRDVVVKDAEQHRVRVIAGDEARADLVEELARDAGVAGERLDDGREVLLDRLHCELGVALRPDQLGGQVAGVAARTPSRHSGSE